MSYKDKEQQKKFQKQHYLNNKDKYNESKKKWIADLRAMVSDLKEKTPCQDCGEHFPACVMDYDHRNPKEKINGVARLVSRGSSYEKVLQEIAKCDLVCANCHRIRTQKCKNSGLLL